MCSIQATEPQNIPLLPSALRSSSSGVGGTFPRVGQGEEDCSARPSPAGVHPAAAQLLRAGAGVGKGRFSTDPGVWQLAGLLPARSPEEPAGGGQGWGPASWTKGLDYSVQAYPLPTSRKNTAPRTSPPPPLPKKPKTRG